MDLRILRRAARLPTAQVTQRRTAYLHFLMVLVFPRRGVRKPRTRDFQEISKSAPGGFYMPIAW